VLKGYIEVVVWDRDGRIVQSGRHEMHSFLNNLLKFFEAFFKGDGLGVGVSMADTGGTTRTVVGAANNSRQSRLGTAAASGDDSYGILVGSGTTPVDMNQYTLASKIPHGTSAGQLSYGPLSLDDLGVVQTVSPPVYRFRLVRSFTNASTSSVTINEIGVAVRYRFADYDYRFLVARDVLPSSYTVPAGGSASVAVTIEVELG